MTTTRTSAICSLLFAVGLSVRAGAAQARTETCHPASRQQIAGLFDQKSQLAR